MLIGPRYPRPGHRITQAFVSGRLDKKNESYLQVVLIYKPAPTSDDTGKHGELC